MHIIGPIQFSVAGRRRRRRFTRKEESVPHADEIDFAVDFPQLHIFLISISVASTRTPATPSVELRI